MVRHRIPSSNRDNPRHHVTDDVKGIHKKSKKSGSSSKFGFVLKAILVCALGGSKSNSKFCADAL